MAAPRIPETEPLGLDVARTGRILNRAFDQALATRGGSLPVWLIVMSLMRGDHTMQRDIAAAVGLEGATLTHHLNRMEDAGLVVRRRTPEDRRNQVVELTDEGRALFFTLLDAVVAFDRRLCAGFKRAEIETLRGYLDRLRANASQESG